MLAQGVSADRDFTSELSDIPGIGAIRKMKLLKKFGSVERIAKCDEEALLAVVGKSAAREIIQHFEKQRSLAATPVDPTQN